MQNKRLLSVDFECSILHMIDSHPGRPRHGPQTLPAAVPGPTAPYEFNLTTNYSIRTDCNRSGVLAQLYTPYILGYGTASLSSGKAGWTLYECVDCGNKYKHKGSLQRHIKYECRKQPSFKCPYCVYRAYQKHNLLLHERHLHKDLPEKVDFVSE
ncbi:unnamed protein product [Colias eurytheme]|nr:unnamed protein product [Colias eurytheme]